MTRFVLACFIIIFTLKAQHSFAQTEPRYTQKLLLTAYDSNRVKVVLSENGFMRTYLQFSVELWDVDDDNTTHIRGGRMAIVVIEGQRVNGKREGLFKAYVLDSVNRDLRYKIWEQNYKDDKLNGEWRTYNLRGVLVEVKTLLNNELNGLTKQFWIDGKTIMVERVHHNSISDFTERTMHSNGKIRTEVEVVNDKANGVFREFYPSGILMDSVRFVNSQREGLRTYNYPDGRTWILQEYKNGKPWTIIANYDSKGNKRNAGTLKNGNGTVIYYDDDTTVREVISYRNGEPIQ